MEWKDEYEIGIIEIDEQHKHLFNLVNNLKKDMAGSLSNEEVLAETLPKIVAYALEHFHYEEKVMKELHFTGIEKQRIQHQNLIKEIKEILNQMKWGRKYNPIQLYNLLSQWLLEHFVVEDRKLKEFVQNMS